MRRGCKFQMNQTFLFGMLLSCSALLLKNTLEPTGGASAPPVLCPGRGGGATGGRVTVRLPQDAGPPSRLQASPAGLGIRQERQNKKEDIQNGSFF